LIIWTTVTDVGDTARPRNMNKGFLDGKSARTAYGMKTWFCCLW